MKYFILTALFFCLTLNSSNLFAQNSRIQDPTDSLKVYQVELSDGTIFMGFILFKDSNVLVMKTTSIPRLEIPMEKVRSCEVMEHTTLKDGAYWFGNPHATRYLFGPSAINLKKREKYYQNTWLFLNSFNIGITDHFSIGGSIEMISTTLSLATGNFSPTILITPKIGYQLADKVHAGGGVLYANILGEQSAGIAYGITTYGTYDNNITGGLGWGFINGSFSSRPIITFSGMKRVSRKLALVSENWLIPSSSYYGIYSYGIRFFSEKMAVDLALVNNPDIASLLKIGIPFASYTLKF
ncbi:MAG: hypothetical protein RI948_301 [Bacteroidota bacterium]|jgi:hypothetical protein